MLGGDGGRDILSSFSNMLSRVVLFLGVNLFRFYEDFQVDPSNSKEKSPEVRVKAPTAQKEYVGTCF